jgi:hypothetical protein
MQGSSQRSQPGAQQQPDAVGGAGRGDGGAHISSSSACTAMDEQLPPWPSITIALLSVCST